MSLSVASPYCFRRTSGGPWLPTMIPGLRLWIRADLGITLVGDRVSVAADQSGNALDFIQPIASARPLWVNSVVNGHPVIRGDGIGDFLRTSGIAISPGNTTRTIFLVCNPKLLISEAVICDGFRTGAAGVWQVDPRTFVSTVGGFSGWAGMSASAFNYYTFIQTSTDMASVLFRINNGSNEVRTSHTNVVINTAAGSGMLCQMATATLPFGQFSDADIAEYIVFNRTLTALEIVDVHNYLASRYAL